VAAWRRHDQAPDPTPNQIKTRPPENFEEFILEKMGEGIARHFMIPYNHKLWGVHPREITAEWCSRFVPVPKLDEVVAGAVGANPPEMGYNIHFLYPREGGIETMTRALVARLNTSPDDKADQKTGGQVHLRSQPDSIDWRQKHVSIGGERVP